MSRHGYCDDSEPWSLIRWRGAVASAIKGKKGQAFLKELATGMDAMPIKELIEGELVTQDGEVCAIGVVCKVRGLDVSEVDLEESEVIAGMVGIAEALVKEIEFENDDGCYLNESPNQRWVRMRKWVADHIKPSEIPSLIPAS